jgi:hypothetical protein
MAVLHGRSTWTLGGVNARTVIAFLVSPLVAAALFASVSWLSSGLSNDPLEPFATAVVVFVYAGIGMGILAFPAYVLLNRVGLVRWWSASGAGAVLGLIFDLGFGSSWSSPWLRGHFGMAAIGAISGLAFWSVWRRSTPPN